MDDDIIFWKNLHTQLLSAESLSNELFNIDGLLFNKYKNKLARGLLYYKPYSKESYIKWYDKVAFGCELLEEDEVTNLFVNNLSEELDLDVTVCWKMLLMNLLAYETDIRKILKLKAFVRCDCTTIALIENTWSFFTNERLLLLQILRHIFEKVRDKNNVLHKMYCRFIETINLQELWNNLNQTFDNLYTDLYKKKYSITVKKHIPIKKWADVHYKEQVEVVLLMVDVLDHYKLSPIEFNASVSKFSRRGFGRTALYEDVNAEMSQSFWKSLFEPLLLNFERPARVYVYVFHIIALQFRQPIIEQCPLFLNAVINFVENVQQVTKLFDFFVNSAETAETEEDLFFINIFFLDWSLFCDLILSSD